MKPLKWLECITAAVLVAVLLAVAGMIFAVSDPALAIRVSEDRAVIAVIGVLVLALILVSAVALSRRDGRRK